MDKIHLTHTAAELDDAISLWQNTVSPQGSAPSQVVLTAVCDPTKPEVIVSWSYRDDNVARIIVRRKLGSVPGNLYDGDAVCDIDDPSTTSFTDTNFTSFEGVGTMDAPAVYYYRAFVYSASKQIQTEYQLTNKIGATSCNVYYFMGGKKLSDFGESNLLNLSLVFGRYGSATDNSLVWTVVHVDAEQQIAYLMLKGSPVGNMQYDANETTRNSSDTRYSNGNSRWSVSNIRQWLNSNGAANKWYEAQHDYDSAPSYASSYAGFLHYFTEAEIELIVPITHTLYVPEADGGGTETVTDTVWLPSTVELGLQSENDEGSLKFDAFSDAASRKWDYNYWTRTINNYTSATHPYCCSSAGGLYYHASYGNNIAARAGLVLPLSSLVEYDVDKEMYSVVAPES